MILFCWDTELSSKLEIFYCNLCLSVANVSLQRYELSLESLFALSVGDMDPLTLTYITLLSVAILLWLYTLILLFSGGVKPIWAIIKVKFKVSSHPLDHRQKG